MLIVITSCQTAEKLPTDPQPLYVLQGPTDEHSSEFAVLGPQGVNLQIFAKPLKGTVSYKADLKTHTHRGSPWVVQRFAFKGLPSGDYYLVIKDDKDREWDKRLFHTLQIRAKNLRFAVASCMDDSFKDVQKVMWQGMIDAKPDMIFLIGDNAYVDKVPGLVGPADPDLMWTRHVETRSRLKIFRTYELTPIWVVWDDNDYGMNDGDMTNKYRNESTDIYKIFFALGENNLVTHFGPGISKIS